MLLSAPSAKHRHHSPEWTILSHVSCFIEGEVHRFQFLLGSLHPQERPSGLLQFSKGEAFPLGELEEQAVKICLLTCDASDICAVWPNRDRCHTWIANLLHSPHLKLQSCGRRVVCIFIFIIVVNLANRILNQDVTAVWIVIQVWCAGCSM